MHASASARSSPGGTTSPSAEVAHGLAERADVGDDAGRPWPIAVASTPDASVRRYGRTTIAASCISAATSSSGRKPRRHSIRVVDAELARELLQRLDGIERIAGDDEPRVRDVRERAHEHVDSLVRAQQAEEEQRRAASAGSAPRRAATRTPRAGCTRCARASTPSAASSSTPRREWTITRSTMSYTRRRASTPAPSSRGSAWCAVNTVGVAAATLRSQRTSKRGSDEPLHVHDVRLELAQPAREAADARQVLEPLDDVARARARIAREYPAADRQEELVAAIADRRGNGPERKGRREQIDGVAATRERARKTVVVRRRRARRIDDGDTHCGDDTSVTSLAREHALPCA